MRGASRLLVLAVALLTAPVAASAGGAVFDVAPGSVPAAGADVTLFARSSAVPADARVLFALVPATAPPPTAAASVPLDGPHVHGPRTGWNDVHIPTASESAPTLRVRHEDAPAPREAYVRAPEPLPGGGWRVPALLPWAGNWTIEARAGEDNWTVPMLVPAEAPDAAVRAPRREGPGDPVLVAREPSLVTADGSTRVRFTLLHLDAAGAWRALDADARATVAGQRAGAAAYAFDVPLERVAPDAFETELDLGEGRWELRVNLTAGALRGASLALTARVAPPATGEAASGARVGDAWSATVRVPAPGAYLALAHGGGAHGEARVAASARDGPWALLVPARFGAAGRVEGALTLREPDGRLLHEAAGNVSASLLPGGEAVALTPDGAGGFSFEADLPAGEHRLLVQAAGWSDEVPFTVGRPAGGGDAVGAGGADVDAVGGGVGPSVLIGALVGGVAVAGLAWALYRGRRMRPGP